MPRWQPKPDAYYFAAIKARTVETPSGCWEWTGFYRPESKMRYAEVYCRGKKWRAHRLMYTIAKGPIPDGLVVRHKCDNSICQNPDHMELGTQYDNCQDAVKKGRYWHHASRYKACKRGHEFTPENTYIDPRGFRLCRECNRQRLRTPEYRRKANERLRARRAAKRLSQNGSESLP